MRGKEIAQGGSRHTFGITPAHAGKSICHTVKLAGNWDHPRACGEKLASNLLLSIQLGSPPRMRGKVSNVIVPNGGNGITPAHAGKRIRKLETQDQYRDHPRACGEKLLRGDTAWICLGSPPRMRGKEYRGMAHIARSGITPAHAGKS